jgi:hypothetical protein
MDRNELTELHYITPRENVRSIAERGILSNARARVVGHASVANEEVQRRRTERAIPGGRRLHDYANLYVNGRNAMMYRILNDYDLTRRVAASDLLVLRVAVDILDTNGVVVTDINAAADVAPRWHTVADGVARLDRDEVFATQWRDYTHRQRMMAEVLVPDRVPPEFIFGAYVVSDDAAAALAQTFPTLDPEVNPKMFFRPS